MYNTKRLFTLLALLALAASAQAADKVKIGFLSTLSGPGAGLGVDIRDGFNLAVKQLNGKLGGLPAEILLTDDQQNERPRFGVEVHGGVVDSADVLLNVAGVKYVFNIAGGQKAVEYIDKAYALVDAHAGDPAVECFVHVFCAAGNFLQRMECTVRHLP